MHDRTHLRRRLPVICILALLLFSTGCAASLSGQERMRLAGHELSQQYLQLHHQYSELMQHLPENARMQLRSRAAPVLNRLKHSLVAFNQSVLAWSAREPDSDPPRNLEEVLIKTSRLAGMAAQLLQEAAHDRH